MGRQRIYVYLSFAVVATTIFGWFRLNSLFIILLAAYKLWENGPLSAVKKAFSNKYVWAYLLFFLVETAGLLHTHNAKSGADTVAKDATLVAIAFIICAGNFIDTRGYRQLMTGYCLALAAASLYCLVVATGHYLHDRDVSVFFYHPLTSPISQNAVFYSVYVLFGALYLLSPGGGLILPERLARIRRPLQLLLIVFFTGMTILLSSKLILVILLIVVAIALNEHYSKGRRPKVVLTLGISCVLVVGVLAFTNNLVKARFSELLTSDLEMIKSEHFFPGTAFNYLQIRVLECHFAVEILNEHSAWLFGVSPGDSQDLLDAKYVAANMYIGDPAQGPHRKVRGFIGYNFHNQYMETLVRDGIPGLAALLYIFWLLAGIVRRWRTRPALFTVLTLLLFFVPEAPLTMQSGIFLFCFFPLLLLYSPKQAG
jgi:O-antigen ligase